MKKMKADPYYNALQVKYAYAVTCHKAQGGQWKNVFLDQGYITDDHLTPDYFRWLYTALPELRGRFTWSIIRRIVWSKFVRRECLACHLPAKERLYDTSYA